MHLLFGRSIGLSRTSSALVHRSRLFLPVSVAKSRFSVEGLQIDSAPCRPRQLKIYSSKDLKDCKLVAMYSPFQNFKDIPEVFEIQKQLAEAQNARYGLDRQLSMLSRQMSDDSPYSSKSTTFDDAIQSNWESQEASMTSSDEDEEEATYKLKYMRLKERFNKMATSHLDELDTLHEEIARLQDRVQKLDAARCIALTNEATLAETLQATTSQVGSELAELCCENHTLYCENEALMQELVAAKLEMAQLREREVVWKRELFKAKESNKSLASQMAKLDALMAEIAGRR